jgi:hypothetical protein
MLTRRLYSSSSIQSRIRHFWNRCRTESSRIFLLCIR